MAWADGRLIPGEERLFQGILALDYWDDAGSRAALGRDEKVDLSASLAARGRADRIRLPFVPSCVADELAVRPPLDRMALLGLAFAMGRIDGETTGEEQLVYWNRLRPLMALAGEDGESMDEWAMQQVGAIISTELRVPALTSDAVTIEQAVPVLGPVDADTAAAYSEGMARR